MLIGWVIDGQWDWKKGYYCFQTESEHEKQIFKSRQQCAGYQIQIKKQQSQSSKL